MRLILIVLLLGGLGSAGVHWWNEPEGTWVLDRDATLQHRLALIERLTAAAASSSNDPAERWADELASSWIGSLMAMGASASLEASESILTLDGDGTFFLEEFSPLTGPIAAEGHWHALEGGEGLRLSLEGEAMLDARRDGRSLLLSPVGRPELVLVALRRSVLGVDL